MKTKTPRFLFLLFGMLYFVQGVITAYQLNFFKPHMTSEGIGADALGMVATLALLPFIVKSIFGILSDRVSLFGRGHRVPYMIVGVIGCAVAFALAFFIDPGTQFGLVALMVVSATFFMALFDTTADAYAVDMIPEEDHSRVQSWMTGGRAAGLIILSSVFGLIAERWGFQPIFLVIAICLLLPLLMLFRVKEPTKRAKNEQFQWRAFGALLKPANLVFAVFLIVAWVAMQGIDGLITLFMQEELGATERMLGSWGSLKGIGMVIGALLVFVSSRFIGRRTLGLVTLVLITIGGLIFSTVTEIDLLLTLAIFWGIAVGLHWTVYATLAMNITDKRIAASMFAIFQTMANIGLAAGEGLGVSMASRVGYNAVFRNFGLLNLLAIPLLFVVYYMLNRSSKSN